MASKYASQAQLDLIAKLQRQLGLSVEVFVKLTRTQAKLTINDLISSAREQSARERAARRQQWNAERDAELANTPPIQSGKQEFVGTITTTKWQPSDFGTSPKMLVVAENGNRLWSTIPAAIVQTVADEIDKLKGKSVAVYAEILPKDGDAHFAFAKRPRAKLV